MSQSESSNSEGENSLNIPAETNSPEESREELLAKLKEISEKLRCKTRKVTSLRRSLQRVRRDSEYENSYGPKYQQDKILSLSEIFQTDPVNNVHCTEIPYLCDSEVKTIQDNLHYLSQEIANCQPVSQARDRLEIGKKLQSPDDSVYNISKDVEQSLRGRSLKFRNLYAQTQADNPESTLVLDPHPVNVPAVPVTGRIDLTGTAYIPPIAMPSDLLKKDRKTKLYRGYSQNFSEGHLAVTGYYNNLSIGHVDQEVEPKDSDLSMYGDEPNTPSRAQCLGIEPPMGTLQKCMDYIDFHYNIPWNYKGLADGTVNTDLSDEFCSVRKIYFGENKFDPWFSLMFCILIAVMVTYSIFSSPSLGLMSILVMFSAELLLFKGRKGSLVSGLIWNLIAPCTPWMARVIGVSIFLVCKILCFMKTVGIGVHFVVNEVLDHMDGSVDLRPKKYPIAKGLTIPQNYLTIYQDIFNFLAHHSHLKDLNVADFVAVDDLKNKNLLKIGRHVTHKIKHQNKIRKDKDFTLIPLHLRNGLPFISARTPGSEKERIFLIDTGCKFNLMNEKSVQEIERSLGSKLSKFKHSTYLAGHAGGSIELWDYGVIIPLEFNLGKNGWFSLDLPVLVERSLNSSAIIGFDYITALNIHFSKGFKSIEAVVARKVALPKDWMPKLHSYYKGSVSAYRKSSYDKRSIIFEIKGFANYSGCVILQHLSDMWGEKIMSDPEVVHLLYGIPCELSSDFTNILDRNGSFMRFSAITYACSSIGEKCNRSVKARPGPNSDVFIKHLVNHVDKTTPETISEVEVEKTIRAVDLSVQLSNIVAPRREERLMPLTFCYPPDPWGTVPKQVEDPAPGSPAVALIERGQGIIVNPGHKDHCCTAMGGMGLDAKSALDLREKPSELNSRSMHHALRPSAFIDADEIVLVSPGNIGFTEKIVADNNFTEEIIDIEATSDFPSWEGGRVLESQASPMLKKTKDIASDAITKVKELDDLLEDIQVNKELWEHRPHNSSTGEQSCLHRFDNLESKERHRLENDYIQKVNNLVEDVKDDPSAFVFNIYNADNEAVYSPKNVTVKDAIQSLPEKQSPNRLQDFESLESFIPSDDESIEDRAASQAEDLEYPFSVPDYDRPLSDHDVDVYDHDLYKHSVMANRDNILEIQIKDLENCCLICESTCQCTVHRRSRKKYFIFAKRLERNSGQRYKVWRTQNVITLICEPNKVQEYGAILAEHIWEAVHEKAEIDYYRIGNRINLNYGANRAITEKILQFFERASWPLGLRFLRTYPVGPDVQEYLGNAEVHHLEYNEEEGIHVGSPLLENDTIGLPDSMFTHPGEVKFMHESEDVHKNDIPELLKESHEDFVSIISDVLKHCPDVMIKNQEDFGALLYPDFAMDIKLTNDGEENMPRHKPYACSNHQARIVDKLVNFWVQTELAAPSHNKDWASRLIIVRKKISDRQYANIRAEIVANGQHTFSSYRHDELFSIDAESLSIKALQALYRICLDARDLNRVTQEVVGVSQNPEATLFSIMMNMESRDPKLSTNITLEQLRKSDPFGSEDEYLRPGLSSLAVEQITEKIMNLSDDGSQKYFYSSLDISSAHTSVKLTQNASHLLNFITPSLQMFKFLRSAFGLRSISTYFNTILIQILSDLVKLGLIVLYADDILVMTTCKRTHIAVIVTVLERFARHGIKLSLQKCVIGVKKFRYIGYLFDETGISLSEDRISAITNFPAPIDKKGVQRLIGMLNFISKWIPNYSFNVFAISELLKCKNPEDFHWGKEQDKAFDDIKEIINSNLRLNYVPADEQLYLYVDSSNVAGGAVLCAGEPDTEYFRPVVYFSKKYSEATRKASSALDAECLNLLYSLEKCKFFTSAKKKIIVRTDARTILYLLFGSRKTQNAKLARMANKISEYLVDFDIGYCKPNFPAFLAADAISRKHSQKEFYYPAAFCRALEKTDITVPEKGVFNLDGLIKIVDKNEIVEIPEGLGHNGVRLKGVAAPAGQPESKDQFTPEGPNPKDAVLVGNHPDGKDLVVGHQDGEPARKFVNHILLLKNIPELEHINVQEECKKDHRLGPILNDFMIGESAARIKYPNFEILPPGILCDKSRGTYRLCIPDSLLKVFAAAAHVQYGHRGAKNLTGIVGVNYHHPKMSDAIDKIVRKCHLCMMCTPNPHRKGQIDAFRVCDHPNEVWGMDYFKMEKTIEGYEYVLIIVDFFSGYTILHKCKRQTAADTINALRKAFVHLSMPKELRSDNARNLLQSKDVLNFLKEHNVFARTYPPNYRLHNPVTERQVKTCRHIFRYHRAHCERQYFDWARHVEEVNTLLNAIPRKYRSQGETKYISPFELYFSRPTDFLKIPDGYTSSRLTSLEAREEYSSELKAFVKGAIESLKGAYQQAHNFNANKHPVVNVNDFFLVKNKATPAQGEVSKKHQTVYRDTVYICKNVIGRTVQGENLWNGNVIFANVDDIKVYLERENYFSELPEAIRKHVGGEFEVNARPEVRREVLKKLRDLNMFLKERRDPISGPLDSEGDSGSVVLSEARSVSDRSFIDECNSDFSFVPSSWNSDINREMPFPHVQDYRYMADYIPLGQEELGNTSKISVEPTDAPEKSASNGYSNPEVYRLQQTTFNEVEIENENNTMISDFTVQAELQERQVIDELDSLRLSENVRRESEPGVTPRDNSKGTEPTVSQRNSKSSVSDIGELSQNNSRLNMFEDTFRVIANTTRSKANSVKKSSVKFLGSLRKSERSKIPNTLFPKDKWDMDRL